MTVFLVASDAQFVNRVLEQLEERDCEGVAERVRFDLTVRALHRWIDDSGRLRPFAELLLRELAAIAAEPGVTAARRHERATLVMRLGGFDE